MKTNLVSFMNKKKHIFIVDDEEEISSLLSYLIKNDFDVETTLLKNGEEAIFQLEQQNPDMIICDYTMPIKNGLDVLRRNHQLKNCPFIMLTGDFPDKYPELASIKNLNQHNEVLTKPFSPVAILDLIEKILEIKR
ncbi:MAG: response regulator [Bacteriovoracaceae bacterium]